jgi:DNA-binding beta-propeller fold protein YncE
MRSIAFLCLLVALAGPVAAQDRPFASFDLAGPPVLDDPHDLAVGPDGRVYVADKLGARIAVLDPETLEEVGSVGDGALPQVRDVSFGRDGRVAVAVTGLGAVLVFESLDGAAPEPSAILAAPRSEGALLHSNGRVYAMASGTGTLLAYDGEDVVARAEGHFGAHDVAEGPEGDIWVADNRSRRLVRYAQDLTELQVIDHEKYGFRGPRYMDVDPFGRLVVADQESHRILLIDPAGPDGGSLLGVLGKGAPGAGPNLFDDPEGIAISGNRFYISDSDNDRVVRYSIILN